MIDEHAIMLSNLCNDSSTTTRRDEGSVDVIDHSRKAMYDVKMGNFAHE